MFSFNLATLQFNVSEVESNNGKLSRKFISCSAGWGNWNRGSWAAVPTDGSVIRRMANSICSNTTLCYWHCEWAALRTPLWSVVESAPLVGDTWSLRFGSDTVLSTPGRVAPPATNPSVLRRTGEWLQVSDRVARGVWRERGAPRERSRARLQMVRRWCRAREREPKRRAGHWL